MRDKENKDRLGSSERVARTQNEVGPVSVVITLVQPSSYGSE